MTDVITRNWLEEKRACGAGLRWVSEHADLDAGISTVDLLRMLADADKFDWANWLFVQTADDNQNRRYAIAAAKLVLHISEYTHPDDDRPRKAIEAAEAYVDNPCDETRSAAAAAADAADAAAAYAAADVAAAAADAADAAAAAAAVAYAVAAAAAADAAAAAYDAAGIKTQIVEVGIEILKAGAKRRGL